MWTQMWNLSLHLAIRKRPSCYFTDPSGNLLGQEKPEVYTSAFYRTVYPVLVKGVVTNVNGWENVFQPYTKVFWQCEECFLLIWMLDNDSVSFALHASLIISTEISNSDATYAVSERLHTVTILVNSSARNNLHWCGGAEQIREESRKCDAWDFSNLAVTHIPHYWCKVLT